MSRLGFGRLFGLALTLLASPLAVSGDQAIDPVDLEALTEAIDRIRRTESVAATAFVVVERGGSSTVRTLGIRDRASGEPVTEATRFRIGSLTKLFVSLGMLKAEASGHLALDSPVRRLAPAIPLENPWSVNHPVQLRHLLEHTAGLRDLTPREFDHNTPLPLEEALQVAPEARVCQWPPGRHASYSNAGYGLAAYAFERATGQSLTDYVSAHILDPLTMESATFAGDEAVRATLATGYDRDGRTEIPYWHMIFPAFGALNVQPRDMVAPLRLLLNRGRLGDRRLLSADAIDRLEQPTTTLGARAGLDHGYGLGIYSNVAQGFRFYGHGGDADGYLARLGYAPQLGRGYFLVINAFNQGALSRMRDRIEAALVAGAAPPTPPSVPEAAADYGLRWTGRYQEVTTRFAGRRPETLYVTPTKRGIATHVDGTRTEWLAVDEQRFRRAGDPLATAIVVAREASVFWQGPNGNFRRIAGSETQPSNGSSRGMGVSQPPRSVIGD
jgi:CubicO group peptidase (beta-lactamase class C family)